MLGVDSFTEKNNKEFAMVAHIKEKAQYYHKADRSVDS